MTALVLPKGRPLNPSSVYLDPEGCHNKHEPCLRYISNDRCRECGRSTKRRRGSHLVGEDFYCERCGDPLPTNKSGKTLLCGDCYRTLPQWNRGKFYVCVQGPKEFIGGRFRQEEMDWSVKYQSWDAGMVFEEYQDKEYVGTWAVEDRLVPVYGRKR